MAGTHRTCEICGVKERHCLKKRFFGRFPLDKHRCVEWVRVVGNEDLAYLPVEKLHDLKHVCEIHFSKGDFTKSKTRLKKRAVPKLHISSAPLSDQVIAEFLRINSQGDTPSSVQYPGPSTSQAVNPDVVPSSPNNDNAVIASIGSHHQPKNEPISLSQNENEIVLKALKRKLDDCIDVTPRKKKLIMQLQKTKCTLTSLRKSAKLLKNLSSSALKEFVMSALKNQKRKPYGERCIGSQVGTGE